MFSKRLLYLNSAKWILGLMILILLFPQSTTAQLGLAGRNTADFRLNLLRTEISTPHGQQPPYEWAAAYLQDVTSNIQPGTGYVLDSSVCGAGVVNTIQFGEEFKIYYSYNNEGQVSEILFREETSPGVYENYSQKSFSYTGNNRTNYLYQLWNGTTSSWEDDYEEKTTFNGNGRQESFMIREAAMPGQWNNLFRELRIYDSNGNLAEVLAAKWDNGNWQDTARKEILYNDIGFYTQIFDESWNGSGWDTLSRETAQYDNLGMIWEGYLFEENTQNGFVGVVRENYQYDDYGFWTGMNRQTYDDNNSSWENFLRETYAYNRSGVWTRWDQEVYENSAWVNSLRQGYEKQGPLRQDVMQSWDTTGGAWENRFRVITKFDSVRNLEQEAGIQKWDDGSTSWVNTDKSRACQHFWSKIESTSIDPELTELNCTLANPYRVYEPIHCETLHPGQNYDVRLMDMQGRTVYQKAVSGGEIFAIDRNLPTGIYNLSIYENRQIRFLRKIVINY